MTIKSDEEKEFDRLKEVRRYQNNKLFQAQTLGRKARNCKQPIRLNPFSAFSQPHLHAAWNDGFVLQHAEILGEEVGMKPLVLPPMPEGGADAN